MKRIKAKVDGFPREAIEVEILGPNAARVVNARFIWHIAKPGTVAQPVLENDIVRLSHEQETDDDIARVTEVLYKHSPRFYSQIKYGTSRQMYKVIALATVLGARADRLKHWVNVWHDEKINFPDLASAAGIGPGKSDITGEPINLCKVPFGDDDQMHLVISIAVILGVTVLYVDPDDEQLLLFQPDGVDMVAIANAAQISRAAEDMEDLDPLDISPPPGPRPGPEWERGSWGGPDGHTS